jgi:hypothetical protein
MNRNDQMKIGATAVGVAALYYFMLRPKQAEPTLVPLVAEPDYMLHPLRAWMGSGRMGPCHHLYAEHVMANTHPEAIQFAEGTVSVTALAEAPGYERVPSQLGGL